jgi:hypothetical protein
MAHPTPTFLLTARLLAGFALLALVIYPPTWAYLVYAARGGDWVTIARPPLPPGNGIGPNGVFHAALIGALPGPLLLGFFWSMRQLFRRYAQGEVLAQPCVRHLRHMGLFALAFGAGSMIVPTLQALVLTLGTGSVVISLALTDAAIGFLAMGGILLMVSWAMAEATRAAEENAGFV